MANQWPPPRNKKIQVQVPSLPYAQAKVVGKPQEIDRDRFAMYKPEARPRRTEEELKEIQAFVENMEPMKDGAALIRRHRTPDRYGAIITPDMVKSEHDKQTITGTVLKLRLGEGSSFLDKNGNMVHIDFGPGDYVLFTQYAPFLAYHKYPEIQIIHVEDVLFKLKKLPPDVVDD